MTRKSAVAHQPRPMPIPGDMTLAHLQRHLTEAGYTASLQDVGRAWALRYDGKLPGVVVEGVFIITAGIHEVARLLGLAPAAEGQVGLLGGQPELKITLHHIVDRAPEVAPEPPVEPEPAVCGKDWDTYSVVMSYELNDFYNDAAKALAKAAREEKRRARRVGEKPPQTRSMFSALVREAMEAYRPQVRAKLVGLLPPND